MPVEPRPVDTFTRDNLFLGLPVVEFTPVGGTVIELGILSAASLQKTIEVLQLENRSSGLVTIDREIVSRLESAFEVETQNFRADVSQLIFASAIATPNVANAAQAVVGEAFTVPTTNPTAFVPLDNGLLSETPADTDVSCAAIVNEQVGVGDGVLGTTLGDFTLAFKPFILGDVTRLEEINISTGAVVRVFVPQAGAPASEFEAQVEVGATAISGQIDLFQAIGLGNELRADYAPSFTFEDDLSAASTDAVLDPFLGRLRLPNANAALGKVKATQSMLVDYIYQRLASVTLQPFTRAQVDGSASVKLLSDVGSNFIWTIPSVTVRLTDDDLTFGTDDITSGILRMNLNDDPVGRFGNLVLSSETQANA